MGCTLQKTLALAGAAPYVMYCTITCPY